MRPKRSRKRRWRDAAVVGVLRLERSHGRGHDGPERGGQHVEGNADRKAERAEPVVGVDHEWQRGDPERPRRPLPRDAHVVDEVNPAEPRAPESEQERGEVHPLQLHPALRPAPLLRLVRGVGRRKLSWYHDLLHELRPVTGEEVPKAQLAILDEARGAPAAGGLDGGGSPDACRAGEVDEPPHGGAPGHLQRVVVVDPERLRTCQARLVMVQVAPLRLHERKAGVGLAVWPGRSAEWCAADSPGAARSPSRRSRGTLRPCSLRPSSRAPAL